jgi:hypothetical protein
MTGIVADEMRFADQQTERNASLTEELGRAPDSLPGESPPPSRRMRLDVADSTDQFGTPVALRIA